MAKKKSEIDKIIDSYKADPDSLIGIYQDIMAKHKYLPKEAIERVVERLGISLSQAYEVATFYKSFSLEPVGDNLVHVCMGTACHLRGSPQILESFERELKINEGQTSRDKKFTLETVNCLGACALAPLVKVNEDNHGQMAASKVKKLVNQYKK